MKNFRFLAVALMALLANYAAQADAATGLFVTPQFAHAYELRAMDSTPDGRYLVTGDKQGFIKLWDLRSKLLVRTMVEPFKGKESASDPEITDLKISPDGRWIGVITENRRAMVWDARTGKLAYYLPTPTKRFGLCFGAGAEGCRLYRVSQKAKNGDCIEVLNASDGAILGSIPIAYSISLTASPDGKMLANLYQYKDKLKLDLIDAKTGKTIRSLREEVSSATFSPDGTLIAATLPSSPDVKVFSASSGKAVGAYKGHAKRPSCLAFSRDGATLAAGGGYYDVVKDKKDLDVNVTIWDVKTKKLLLTTEDPTRFGLQECLGIAYDPEARTLARCSRSGILAYETATGKLSTYSLGRKMANSGASYLEFSPDRRHLFVAMGPVYDIDLGTGIPTRIGQHEFSDISIARSANLAAIDERIVDLATMRTLYTLPGVCQAISDDGKWAAGQAVGEKRIDVYDVRRQKRAYSVATNRDVQRFLLSPDGSTLMFQDSGRGFVWVDVRTGATVGRFPLDESVNTLAWNDRCDTIVASVGASAQLLLIDARGRSLARTISVPDEKLVYRASFDGSGDRLVVAAPASRRIYLIDARSGAIVKTIQNDDGVYLNLAAISGDGKMLASCSAAGDGRIFIDNLENGKSIYYAILGSGRWMAVDDQGHFDGSTGCDSYLAVGNGTECFAIDQFATRLNRPDLLFGGIGFLDPDQAELFRSLYEKRIRKLGLADADGGPSGTPDLAMLRVPTAKIASQEQKGDALSLDLDLEDDFAELSKYSIYVNDVALFGAVGKPLSGRSARVRETMRLVPGVNKVEVSCSDASGAESPRAIALVTGPKAASKPDLYCLAFGVSKYKNPSLDLKYADKDARDIVSLFSSMKWAYGAIHAKAYLNSEVTVESIKAAKDFLKDAKPADIFVLFIAGHGVHDNDQGATYYFLTSETDLNDLPRSAAPFELVEDLLQGIGPRAKVFLMDTCESGEIDDEVQGQYLEAAAGKSIAARGLKVVGTAAPGAAATKAPKRKYLLEKDRFIFNDLARRSGAVVFSSCLGGEFSYESDAVGNGFFTNQVIAALTQPTKGDGNYYLYMSRLESFVTKGVAELSSGLQHPTVDRDNTYVDFLLPIVPK